MECFIIFLGISNKIDNIIFVIICDNIECLDYHETY